MDGEDYKDPWGQQSQLDDALAAFEARKREKEAAANSGKPEETKTASLQSDRPSPPEREEKRPASRSRRSPSPARRSDGRRRSRSRSPRRDRGDGRRRSRSRSRDSGRRQRRRSRSRSRSRDRYRRRTSRSPARDLDRHRSHLRRSRTRSRSRSPRSYDRHKYRDDRERRSPRRSRSRSPRRRSKDRSNDQPGSEPPEMAFQYTAAQLAEMLLEIHSGMAPREMLSHVLASDTEVFRLHADSKRLSSAREVRSFFSGDYRWRCFCSKRIMVRGNSNDSAEFALDLYPAMKGPCFTPKGISIESLGYPVAVLYRARDHKIDRVWVCQDKDNVAERSMAEDDVYSTRVFEEALDIMTRPGGLRGSDIERHYNDYTKVEVIG